MTTSISKMIQNKIKKSSGNNKMPLIQNEWIEFVLAQKENLNWLISEISYQKKIPTTTPVQEITLSVEQSYGCINNRLCVGIAKIKAKIIEEIPEITFHHFFMIHYLSWVSIEELMISDNSDEDIKSILKTRIANENYPGEQFKEWYDNRYANSITKITKYGKSRIHVKQEKKARISPDIIYYRHGKKYQKLKRDEVIKEGAMQSWCNGELQPITNADGETIGNTPSSFSDQRDFYNPIE